MGIKLVNGIVFHACLKELEAPQTDQNGAGITEYFTTVISLVGMVTWNFEVIKLMIKTAQQDRMTYLAKSSANIRYREDSPASKSSESSESSSLQLDWEQEEAKLRILDKMKNNIDELAQKANEDYVWFSWESIAFEDKQSY
ncbi:unnamed protein product [Mucor hiemalis]